MRIPRQESRQPNIRLNKLSEAVHYCLINPKQHVGRPRKELLSLRGSSPQCFVTSFFFDVGAAFYLLIVL